MVQEFPAGPRDKFWGMMIGRKLQKQTLEFVTDVSRNYGDLTYFKLGPFRIYTVNCPKLVREVLVTKAKQFPKVARSTKVLSQFDGQGLAVSSGDFWLRQRKLVQPAFHIRRMTRYAEVTVDLTRRRMEQWQAGKISNLANEMTDLAIEVISKALFDVDTGKQTEELRRAVEIFSETLFFEISAPLVLPDWLPLPSKRRKRWAIQTVDTMIRNIIRERRASKDDRGDLLSMLLLAVDEGEGGRGMTDEQARDEAVTMFRGGHDTSAAGLVWIWYLLAKHPEAEARVIQEIDSVLQGRTPTFADLPQLPFTEIVVKETLRLYPPIWALFGREASADVELGGFTVPAKSQILILPWGLQRNPKLFDNADKFDPDRFSPERIKSLTPDAYIPFGLGPHICIGQSFAMMQMVLTTATVLQKYRWSIAPEQGSVEPEAHVAIRPKGGLKMVATGRG